LFGGKPGKLRLPLFKQTEGLAYTEDLTEDIAPGWIETHISKCLLEDMSDFLAGLKDVGGLAANQIEYTDVPGKSLQARFFVIYRKESGSFDWFLNPVITGCSNDSSEKTEGCLTWPGKLILTERYDNVALNYFDLNGNMHTEEFEGYESQIVQHETDHLNGVLEQVVSRDYRTVRKTEKLPGRNDLCLCGSGKKYKKCCGKN